MKNEKILKILEAAAPKTRQARRNVNCFLSLTALTIPKYKKMAKRKGVKAISESKRLILSTADNRDTIINSNSGRSKGVLLNVNFPSVIVFKIKNINKIDVAATKAICLGSTKESVVALKKRRGNTKRKIPITKRLMF